MKKRAVTVFGRLSAMADPTADQYYLEAFRTWYPELIAVLPIDDLLPYFFKAGVLTRNLKEELNSIPATHSKKVMRLLDAIEPGLQAGITDQFESFICVMEEFSTVNNNIVVKKLADDIRLTINPSGAHLSSTGHEISGQSHIRHPIKHTGPRLHHHVTHV